MPCEDLVEVKRNGLKKMMLKVNRSNKQSIEALTMVRASSEYILSKLNYPPDSYGGIPVFSIEF